MVILQNIPEIKVEKGKVLRNILHNCHGRISTLNRNVNCVKDSDLAHEGVPLHGQAVKSLKSLVSNMFISIVHVMSVNVLEYTINIIFTEV